MNRKLNIFDNILSFLLLAGSFLSLVLLFKELDYLFFVIGVAGFAIIVTVLHELGHLIFGKANGFSLASIKFFFFKWIKVGGKTKFKFVWIGSEAGATEMFPTKTNGLDKGYKRLAIGGIVFSAIFLVLSALPVVFYGYMTPMVYSLLFGALPAGVYSFFNNALPMCADGFRNDGATIMGLNKKDDVAQIQTKMLQIQGFLYEGKQFKDISEECFEFPVVQADDPYFVMASMLKYDYLIDKGDYKGAKDLIDRLLALSDDMSKAMVKIVKLARLFGACTFDFNEDEADEIMYEFENYLNNNDNATTVRLKLAYLTRVRGEVDVDDEFYNKGLEEAEKCYFKGEESFEKDLLLKLKEGYDWGKSSEKIEEAQEVKNEVEKEITD